MPTHRLISDKRSKDTEIDYLFAWLFVFLQATDMISELANFCGIFKPKTQEVGFCLFGEW